jgi:hypothetical protein
VFGGGNGGDQVGVLAVGLAHEGEGFLHEGED